MMSAEFSVRGAADPAAGIKHRAVARDPDQVDQLADGDATHGVEVLEQREVSGLEVVEVLWRGNEGSLNVAPGEAS
jgi:hypothetical protein